MESEALHTIIAISERLDQLARVNIRHFQPLQLSGRRPLFPTKQIDSFWQDRRQLLRAETAAKVQRIISESIAQYRRRATAQCAQVLARLHSDETRSISDEVVEEHVVNMFETQYRKHVSNIVSLLIDVFDETRGVETAKSSGSTQRTSSILQASFQYTQSPTVAEIDHLSRLTGLKTHQVRTWFQNKRNRRAKADRLRAASGSAVQGPTQVPVHAGRRVASLPSRAKKGLPAAPGGRVTRPLPRRGQQYAGQDVPLVRTSSHDSDSTTFSWSSIPSNGGFTGPQYPTATTPPPSNPITTLNSVLGTPSDQPQQGQQSYFPTPNSVLPSTVDLSSFMLTSESTTPLPQLPLDNLDTLNFEQYLNFNIDALAPPVDDFSLNLEAEIQAALRPMDPAAFANLNLTLAPSPSTASSGNGSPGAGSDYSAAEWFPELSAEEAESMEMLKVYLDGFDFTTPPLEDVVADHSSPFGPVDEINSAFNSVHAAPSIPMAEKELVPLQSPVETIANVSLASGRASPNDGITTSDFSLDLEEMPVNFEMSEMGESMDTEMDRGVGCSSGAGMSGKEDGQEWMMGVLPFDSMMSETWIEA